MSRRERQAAYEPKRLAIDRDWMLDVLAELLAIPSPTGFTDEIVVAVGRRLRELGLHAEATRRGALRCDLVGERHTPDRAIVVHLDTIGAMVRGVEPDGRIRLIPLGHWSSRFAEGGRVTVTTRRGALRGTVLPLKASGHAFGDAVDTQPVSWEQLRLRIDAEASTREELEALGLAVGDPVAFDPNLELGVEGYVNARHLDDKGGVAAVLAAAKALLDAGTELPVDCALIFTLAEEVGVGASHALQQDVAEMVAIDTGVVAPGQASTETGVSVAMLDASGPFDVALSRRLLDLAGEHGIEAHADVFKHYRSDAAAALAAGNDVRTALVCFGVDGTHGWERTHVRALEGVAGLLALYAQTAPTSERDTRELSPVEEFEDEVEKQGEPNG